MHKILYILFSYNIIFSAPVAMDIAKRVAENIIIEQHFKRIVTPYYAMGFNIGIFSGGLLAGYFINNNFIPWKVF